MMLVMIVVAVMISEDNAGDESSDFMVTVTLLAVMQACDEEIDDHDRDAR